MSTKKLLATVLKKAGIDINGSQSWDPQVIDDRFYSEVVTKGSLGLGESYMSGYWHCADLTSFFTKILRAKLSAKDLPITAYGSIIIQILKNTFIDRGSKSHSKKIGEAHYDVGNDLYRKMLDKRMVYTCAYWKDASTLDEAQEAKLDPQKKG